ncbi:hypothetical protein UNSW1_1092 [Campylobacter concisus UNSW1]|nr:hypothetical protein UNSW1_1092 [Campylobacter concisus UNSW1]
MLLSIKALKAKFLVAIYKYQALLPACTSKISFMLLLVFIAL